MSGQDAQSLRRGSGAACTQGKRTQHGNPPGVIRDDQPDAREGQAGRLEEEARITGGKSRPRGDLQLCRSRRSDSQGAEFLAAQADKSFAREIVFL